MDESTTKFLALVEEYRDTLGQIRKAVDRLTEETLAVVTVAASILKEARAGADESALASRRISRIISEQRTAPDCEV